MTEPIIITSHRSNLWIEPPVPQLEEELRFWDIRMGMKELTVPDRATGGWQTIQVPDGYRKSEELLYSIEDSRMITHEGLFHRVANVLASYDIPYKYRRTAPLPQYNLGPHVVAPMWSEKDKCFLPMRPEQVQAFIRLLAASGCGQKNGPAPRPGSGGAIADMTMSTGKTFLIAAFIRAFIEHEIVITTYKSAVVRRLYEGLNEALKHDGIKVGMLTGGVKAPERVTVCTDKSLHNFDSDKIRVILYDEVHRAGADEISATLLGFTRAVKFGFSGTIKKQIRKKLIEAVFGPVAFRFSDEEAEALGRVSKVKVYAMSVPQGPDIGEKDGMPLERLAIIKNKFRNNLVAEVAAAAPEDMQLIIYCRTIQHMEVLAKDHLPPGYELYHAQLSPAERLRLEKGIYDGSITRMVSNSSFSEGVDTTKLRLLINADWLSSDTSVSQRGGRNRRNDLGKNMGIIVDFRDEWGELARKNRMEQKKKARADTSSLALGGGEFDAPDPTLEEKEEPPDKLFSKAKKRLAQYSDRSWPIEKVSSVSEINFGEVRLPEKSASAPQQTILPL